MAGSRPGLVDDLSVLDLSWGIAGPLGAMLLADNGADIIKVEPPGGDPFRFLPAYHVWNRGKRSVVIDLKKPQGREQLLGLCARADVLVESFRPGTMEQLGLGYEAVHERFPHLVYASISGYGQDGPRRDQPGYEPLVAAWLGLTSEAQSLREGPRYPVFPIGSYGAAMLMVTGVLAALRARGATGKGQRVETSFVDGVFYLATMTWKWSEKPTYTVDTRDMRPSMPKRHLMTMGPMSCADGKYMQIHTGVPGRFAAALDVFGIRDRITPAPPHLEKNAALTDEERTFLLTEVPRLLKAKPRAYWLERLREADVACAPVDPPGAVFEDPQTLHDGTVQQVDDPALGHVRMLGPVLKCNDAPPRIAGPAPAVGEHTEELLRGTSRPRSAAGSGKSLRHPLDGIRIVDFGSFYAGPAASKMLSDLGAEVIKVEPLQGDPFRTTPSAFHPAHRGKRSLALDMKSPEGRAITYKLVARADAVSHNMRPGVAERLGLGYEELIRLRPDLVYLYSPGFGSSGPHAALPAFAPLLSGMCGLHFQAAGRGNAPLKWWIANEDQVGAALGAIWLLMGLRYRDTTGKPVLLESSLFSSALFCAPEVLMKPDGESLFRFELDAGQMGLGALCRLYRSADGWLMLVALQEAEWRALTRVAGLENLGADSRYCDRAARDANDKTLATELAAWFAAHSTETTVRALAAAGVPHEVPRPSKTTEFFVDEGNLRSGSVVEYDYAGLGRIREQGHAVRFSDTPGLIRGPAPRLGEHSRRVLAELGYDGGQIEDLAKRKIVGCEPEALRAGVSSRDDPCGIDSNV